MASTLLEETRQSHEDMERLERLIVKEFKREVKTHKQKLLQGYRVRQMLIMLQQRAGKLVLVYEDADGARKEDITALRGDDPFGNFYGRLKEVRDYHRKFGGAEDLTGPEDDAALVGPEPQLEFSGEEGLGRYLDLHELHQTWQNAKFGALVEYRAYVEALPTHLSTVTRQAKGSASYRQYIDNLLAYLESFYERSQPLSQLSRQWKHFEEEFNTQWAAGKVPGWEDRGQGPNPGNAAIGNGHGGLDLDAFETADELEVLGGDRLRAALASMGLKCGGTPRQRAERLMAVKGKRLEAVDPSLFAKGQRPLKTRGAGSENGANKGSDGWRALALKEGKVARLCDMLSSVMADTLGRIEKRQAQTYEERLAEQEEEEDQDIPLANEEEEEEEEEYIYNPLKLPLGWDGKPIPYWLYKLHGLNLEYKCEICGGASYWGRRAFERHFKEPQHESGMKALGIPNTRQFFEVTTIADAVALWKSLQEREASGFKEDEDEEYEDEEGNVFNRKIYNDLRRQGML